MCFFVAMRIRIPKHHLGFFKSILPKTLICLFLDAGNIPGRKLGFHGLDPWLTSPTYKWGIPWGYNNPLIRSLLIHPLPETSKLLPTLQAFQIPP